MTITDPIEVKHNAKRGKWYIVQGRETFYDANDHLIEFDTAEQAALWAVYNMNLVPINRLQIKGVRQCQSKDTQIEG